MSNPEQVFDMFDEFSRRVHLADKRRKIAAQIRSVTSEACGNCEHWMKTSSCPREKRGEKPSAATPGCEEFTLSASSRGLAIRFEFELLGT